LIPARTHSFGIEIWLLQRIGFAFGLTTGKIYFTEYFQTVDVHDLFMTHRPNSLIIDQWVSLGASSPSGNIDLRSAYYYDVRVDYKYRTGCSSGSCTATARLMWSPNGGRYASEILQCFEGCSLVTVTKFSCRNFF
jgi:hypothetical protein